MLLHPAEVDRAYAREQMRAVPHAFFPRHFAPEAAP